MIKAKEMMKKRIYALFLVVLPIIAGAQNFLHVDGINIVDGDDQNFILRGIGTGNWMLMEGYMMKTTGELGTQHAIRSQLEEEIGKANTDTFFETWLTNHMTRTDVDSMKAWGFNSVRAAMHYNLFTPSIQDEPVEGDITWINTGFEMIDSLLDWCGDNEMYLILDMHGTPGGQGKNADISDYDDTKPSLWESEDNKTKLTALWYELAKRYKDEQWIGGYDLINETNWDFENSGNENGVNCQYNIPLLNMHKRLIDTIRTIDNNHIVFVSGNSWGNNYNGMDELAGHDDNLAYTFHKYWNTNNENDVDWITEERVRLNVPLWMSESGENSNNWFTGAIELFEDNNIGWSWWPVKKEGINNVMYVDLPGSYDTLTKVWKDELSLDLSADFVYRAVLDWAENHKIENCKMKYDVIDAMIRQPHTNETLPYKTLKLTEPIYFTDFDLGKNNYAYFDNVAENVGSGESQWNLGWSYRNDGVDIEACEDTEDVTNGYNVGWTDDNEWMTYSLFSDSIAAYTLTVRSASGAGGNKFHLEVNGVKVTDVLTLPATGGWQAWRNSTFEDIIIPAGEIEIKFYLDQGGSNLSYFKLDEPKAIEDIDFTFMAAKTTSGGDSILVDLNKPITTAEIDLDETEFEFMVDGVITTLTGIGIYNKSDFVLVLTHDEEIYSDNALTLSYNGTSIKNEEQELTAFSDEEIENRLTDVHHVIPGRIQAEDFIINNGFTVSPCSDAGGGYQLGYTKSGFYTIYQVHVLTSGNYQINYRVATERSGNVVNFEVEDGDSFTTLTETTISSTGSWTAWQTQSSGTIQLDEGYYNIRVYIKNGEFDLNWFELGVASSTDKTGDFDEHFSLYPNPASNLVILKSNTDLSSEMNIRVCNTNGQLVYQAVEMSGEHSMNTSDFYKGMYFVSVQNNAQNYTHKLIIQ